MLDKLLDEGIVSNRLISFSLHPANTNAQNLFGAISPINRYFGIFTSGCGHKEGHNDL